MSKATKTAKVATTKKAEGTAPKKTSIETLTKDAPKTETAAPVPVRAPAPVAVPVPAPVAPAAPAVPAAVPVVAPVVAEPAAVRDPNVPAPLADLRNEHRDATAHLATLKQATPRSAESIQQQKQRIQDMAEQISHLEATKPTQTTF